MGNVHSVPGDEITNFSNEDKFGGWDAILAGLELKMDGFKVDFCTQFWIFLCNEQIGPPPHHTPLASVVGPPKGPKISLTVHPGNLPGFPMAVRFTDLDEDTGDQDGSLAGIMQGALFTRLRKLTLDETVLSFFPTVDAGIAFGQKFLGNALPPTIVGWDDLQSDRAMSLLAFSGLGQVYLTKVRNPLVKGVEGAAYEIDLSFLHDYGVRAGFERYGCIPVFAADKRILGIYWCECPRANKFVAPPRAGEDPREWEHVKCVFKSTLVTAITVKDHLVHVHWINSNNLLFATRQSFDEDHPLRRLLKVHTYRTATINWASKETLLPAETLAYRVFAINEQDWYRCLNDCVNACKFQTFEKMVKDKKVPELEDSMPFLKDGRALVAVIRKYVTDYLSLYYKNNAAVLADPAIRAYWLHYSEQPMWPSYQLPALSKNALIEQITHAIFAVTGMHELVGSLVEYLLSPAGLGSKIVPGKAVSDVQSYLLALSLIALTGLRQPALVNDWRHVILHDQMDVAERNAVTNVMNTFQLELTELGTDIHKLNATRAKPFMAMNPLVLECSVSI